jgi:hypothetical protein
MKHLLVLLALSFSSVAFADASKAVQNDKPAIEQKKAPAKKNCDMLKDKNCDKAPPSANKPIPKKKKAEEAK